MTRVAVALGLVMLGCGAPRAWMTDESDRIDRSMNGPYWKPGEQDPALAGIALGPEAPKIASVSSPSKGYEIAPATPRKSKRMGSAPPRAKTASKRAAR